jgi:hypothetical protein
MPTRPNAMEYSFEAIFLMEKNNNMKHHLIPIIITLIVSVIPASQLTGNPICKNKTALALKISNCIMADRVNCYFVNNEALSSYLSTCDAGSLEKEIEISRRILQDIDKISFAFSGTRIIVDSTLILLLADMLSNETVREWVFQTLEQKTSFNSLCNYKKDLLPKIQASGLEARKVNILISLCNRNGHQEIVGDTALVNSLSASLAKSTSFNQSKILVNKLVMCGGDTALKALITNFNKPAFAISKFHKTSLPCTSNTLRVTIIEGLQRYYPFVPILNDSLYFLLRDRALLNNREYVRNYFCMVLKWAEKVIGITPAEPDLPPVIDQGCRMY